MLAWAQALCLWWWFIRLYPYRTMIVYTMLPLQLHDYCHDNQNSSRPAPGLCLHALRARGEDGQGVLVVYDCSLQNYQFVPARTTPTHCHENNLTTSKARARPAQPRASPAWRPVNVGMMRWWCLSRPQQHVQAMLAGIRFVPYRTMMNAARSLSGRNRPQAQVLRGWACGCDGGEVYELFPTELWLFHVQPKHHDLECFMWNYCACLLLKQQCVFDCFKCNEQGGGAPRNVSREWKLFCLFLAQGTPTHTEKFWWGESKFWGT